MRNSLVALHGLNWPGDEHMERFSYIANEHAREAIKDGISEDTIAGILYEKMQHSKALELPINIFRMRAAGDPERSWRGLLRLINDRVERERNEQLRLERTAGTDKLMRGGAKAKPKVADPRDLRHGRYKMDLRNKANATEAKKHMKPRTA